MKGLSYLKPVYTKIAEEEKNIVQQKKKKEENKRAAAKWETDKKSYFAFFCSLPFLVRVLLLSLPSRPVPSRSLAMVRP